MYTFSPKLRLISIILLVGGLVLFGAGFFMNKGIETDEVEQMMVEAHKGGHNAMTHSSEMLAKDHQDHVTIAEHQVHNRPYAALHTVAVFLFGVSACALFFYSIQHAAHAGWPIIVTRVMEAIASYLPFGGAILLLIMVLNVAHVSHMFHWMDPAVTTPGSESFDAILFEKKSFLNVPGYIIRNVIYVVGATFFVWKLKSTSKR